MCQQFLESSIKSGDRYCRATQKQCRPENPACEHFQLGTLFFCDKRGQWIDLKACLSIRKNKQGGYDTKNLTAQHYALIYQMCTNNCKQGQQVQILFDKIDAENGTTTFSPFVKIEKSIEKKVSRINRRRIPEQIQIPIIHRRAK
jgi:hypothetical protein